MSLKKTIKTKSDLESFVKSVQLDKLTPSALKIFNEITALLELIKDNHGRSTEAREAAKQAETLRRKLVEANIPAAKKAPKKKEGSTGPAKKRAPKKPKYDNTSAVNRQGTCLCGCGAEVDRLFLQGHDARLKGKVKVVARGDLNLSTIPKYAIPYIERWSAVSNEDKKAIGASTTKKPWEETENGRPKSWEAYLEAIA